jgi:hypothetical protein
VLRERRLVDKSRPPQADNACHAQPAPLERLSCCGYDCDRRRACQAPSSPLRPPSSWSCCTPREIRLPGRSPRAYPLKSDVLDEKPTEHVSPQWSPRPPTTKGGVSETFFTSAFARCVEALGTAADVIASVATREGATDRNLMQTNRARGLATLQDLTRSLSGGFRPFSDSQPLHHNTSQPSSSRSDCTHAIDGSLCFRLLDTTERHHQPR